jgi:glycosyltransferase involved in cell wall biosynthesis
MKFPDPSKPALSVVVPVYNGERTLEACLQAVRRSSYRDYELIVVNDASTDASEAIAVRFADKVTRHERNLGLPLSRKSGAEMARGEIIVNLDADVVIFPDTLRKISDFFAENPEADAVVGLLSKECPQQGFFSHYKNLYMNYIFSRLPREITFLYGSIHARRRAVHFPYETIQHKLTEDTEMGQQLIRAGKKIRFLPDLEVTHLKRYSMLSFFKNDFLVPFCWADIFLKNRGWRAWGRRSTGFAHSPKKQLASVVLASVIVMLGAISPVWPVPVYVFAALLPVWLLLNLRFLAFLTGERGLLFGLAGVFITFLDNGVMACGIFCGALAVIGGGILRLLK